MVYEHIGDTYDKLGKKSEAFLCGKGASAESSKQGSGRQAGRGLRQTLPSNRRPGRRSAHKFQPSNGRDETMFRRFVEEVAYGCAARVAAVECQRVRVSR